MSNPEIIFEHIKTFDVDQGVSYDTLSELVGHKIQHNRSALFAAVRRLEKERSRTMVNIRGWGYRVAPARAHLDIGRRRVRRSERQMKLSSQVLTHVRKDELTPDEWKLTEAAAHIVQNWAQAVTKMRRDIERHDKVIDSLSQQSVSQQRQVFQVEDRLKRLEDLLGAQPSSAPDYEQVLVT